MSIDRSTKVADKASAAKLLKQWRDEAKRQHLAPPNETRGLTFAAAGVSYLRAGRSGAVRQASSSSLWRDADGEHRAG
jgi:hypothetical protein